jgi:hypothetical protein
MGTSSLIRLAGSYGGAVDRLHRGSCGVDRESIFNIHGQDKWQESIFLVGGHSIGHSGHFFEVVAVVGVALCGIRRGRGCQSSIMAS